MCIFSILFPKGIIHLHLLIFCTLGAPISFLLIVSIHNVFSVEKTDSDLFETLFGNGDIEKL